MCFQTFLQVLLHPSGILLVLFSTQSAGEIFFLADYWRIEGLKRISLPWHAQYVVIKLANSLHQIC